MSDAERLMEIDMTRLRGRYEEGLGSARKACVVEEGPEEIACENKSDQLLSSHGNLSGMAMSVTRSAPKRRKQRLIGRNQRPHLPIPSFDDMLPLPSADIGQSPILSQFETIPSPFPSLIESPSEH